MVVVFLPCLVAFKTFHSHHVAYAAACTCFHLKTFHTCIKEHCLMQLHDIIDFSLPGVCVEVGREVVCCMLDVNWSESCIIVSLNPKLTEGHDAIEQEGKRKSSKRGKRRKQTLVWDDAMVIVDNHNPLPPPPTPHSPISPLLSLLHPAASSLLFTGCHGRAHNSTLPSLLLHYPQWDTPGLWTHGHCKCSIRWLLFQLVTCSVK